MAMVVPPAPKGRRSRPCRRCETDNVTALDRAANRHVDILVRTATAVALGLGEFELSRSRPLETQNGHQTGFSIGLRPESSIRIPLPGLYLRRQCRDTVSALWAGKLRRHGGRHTKVGRCGMRHLIIAATMLFLALGVTFGTASFLQVMAVAQNTRPVSTVVVEAPKPAMKSVVGKERLAAIVRGDLFGSASH